MPTRAHASYLVAVAAVAFLGGPARATLVAVDILDPSGVLVVGGATRDSASNLDWLDLTLTVNLGIHEILGGAGPGAGWVNDGWRYATTAEVCGLFGALGDSISNCPDNQNGQLGDGGDVISAASIPTFLDLLGATFAPSVAATSGAFDDDGFGDDGAGLGVIGFVGPTPVAEAVEDAVAVGGGGSVIVGSFLVSEVPEPSTALLFGLGLAGIGTMRRGG